MFISRLLVISFIAGIIYAIVIIYSFISSLFAFVPNETIEKNCKEININGYFGQMNEKGLSIAITDIRRSSAFSFTDPYLGITDSISAYDKNCDLVLVTILVRNDSDLTSNKDEHMIISISDFKLKGKREYRYDSVTLTKMEAFGLVKSSLKSLNYGESMALILPFGVSKDDIPHELIVGSNFDFYPNIKLSF